MLRYPCLILDHDDTVVQSEATINYPFSAIFWINTVPGRQSRWMNISKAVTVPDLQTCAGNATTLHSRNLPTNTAVGWIMCEPTFRPPIPVLNASFIGRKKKAGCSAWFLTPVLKTSPGIIKPISAFYRTKYTGGIFRLTNANPVRSR